jgi:hypothetical protein
LQKQRFILNGVKTGNYHRSNAIAVRSIGTKKKIVQWQRPINLIKGQNDPVCLRTLDSRRAA